MVVGKLLLPLHQLPEPGDDLEVGKRRRSVGIFLVVPVGGHPLFRHPVHLFGPDLELDQHPFRSDHGRMEGLIHVGLRNGNEVLDPPRHRLVHSMKQTQDAIAVELGVGDDPDPHQVVDFVKGNFLHGHLAIDAVDMLVATDNPSGYAILL